MYNNNVFLIGYVSKDAYFGETKGETKNGSYAKMPVAVHDIFSNNKDNTNFVNIICFKSNLVNNIKSFINKGSLVAIQGYLHSYLYTKDQNKIYSVDVVVNSMYDLTPKKYNQAHTN